MFFELTKLLYKLFLFLIDYFWVIFHLKYLVDQLIELSKLKTYHGAEVVNNLIVFVGWCQTFQAPTASIANAD